MDGGATEIERVESVEDLGHLEKCWNIPSTVIWSFILFSSFLLNATLLLAFLKRPGLRTISNRFVMNLAVSNLLTVVLINFLLIFDKEQSTYGHCSLAEGSTALVTSSSIFSVLLIALDQYLAVVDPLRYRTRIDKLKCAILIFTIWIISIIISLLAAFNQNPKSVWLACSKPINNTIENSTVNFELLFKRQNNNSNLFMEINENIELINPTNSTDNINKTILNIIINNNDDDDDDKFNITYGFIYTVTTGLIVYLLPFISICWIYINIYLAAHKNSERTRRNGSRPILSTCSLTDDNYCPIRHETIVNGDDMRKIPKISSLSSIDESNETATSQLPIQCSNLDNKTSINNNSNDINDDSIVFTVGTERRINTMEIYKKRQEEQLKTKDNIKVPIAILKRQFLSKKYQQQQKKKQNYHHHHQQQQQQQQNDEIINNEIKSRFNDDNNEDKYKSSHDLMYDEMIMQNNFTRFNGRNSDNLTSDTSDSDDDNVNKNDNNDVRYDPPLINNCNFELRDDDNIVENFKEKIENSLSNRENILLSRNNIINSNNGTAVTNTTATPIVTITPPNKISLHRVSSTRSTASYINCLKYRISNASLFKYREETRAARISALVIVMGFICWTPYFILSIIKNISIIINDIPHVLDIVAMSFLIFATYISPLLFGYRSRRVKRELRKFFCFKKELSYKNNRSLMAKKVLKRRQSGNLSHLEMDNKCNIFNCVYGRNKWPKEKVQFVQVPDTALAVETCRSSFSSGASTQISSTSTDEN